MPKYVIEPDLPRARALSTSELHSIAAHSNQVLADMSPRAQWVQTVVTDEKRYCVYVAEDEQAVREHGRSGGFPVCRVSEVMTLIDPTTGQ